MLGLFQADLPIGKRLWGVLLILVITGSLLNGSITISQDPVEFVVQILLFFGSITIWNFILAYPLGWIFILVRRNIPSRYSQINTFDSLVRRDNSDIWLSLFINVAFVISVIIATKYFETQLGNSMGIVGLIIFLVIELFDISLLFKETKEILEIKLEKNGTVTAKLLYKDGEKIYLFVGDFLEAVRRVFDSDWKFVQMSASNSEKYAVFERTIRNSGLSRNIVATALPAKPAVKKSPARKKTK